MEQAEIILKKSQEVVAAAADDESKSRSSRNKDNKNKKTEDTKVEATNDNDKHNQEQVPSPSGGGGETEVVCNNITRLFRCTICFTCLGNDEETLKKGDNSSFTSIIRLFGCLRLSGRHRVETLEQDLLPLCLLCEEHLIGVQRVVDQIAELESALQSLEDDVKSKLINSFEDEGVDEEGEQNHLMEKVVKVRAEMVQQLKRRRNLRGVKRKKPLESPPELVPDNVEKDNETMKQQEETQTIRKSSKGRVIKRPKNYCEIEEAEDIIQQVIQDEDIERNLGETSSDKANVTEGESLIEEDPEWTPAAGAAAVHLDVLPNSVFSEGEDEIMDVNKKSSRRKPINKSFSSSSYKKKSKVKSQPTIVKPVNKVASDEEVQEFQKVPVQIRAKSGEILNALYFSEDTSESLRTAIEGNIFEIEDLKNIRELRLTCFESHCRRTFTTLDKLKAHFKKVHPNSPAGLWQSCKFCDKRFISGHQLRSHLKDMHSEASADSDLKSQYQCSFEGCNKVYKNSKELRIHVRSTHTFETPFSCDFCEEKFVSLVKKEVHVESFHPEVAPLKCELCPKGFFRNHRLRDHIKSHTGEKRFLCDLCGRAFSQPAYLRYHQTKHTELKLEPYKCPECDKTFASPVNLRIHRTTQHLKEYRFRCEVCNHGATHLSHLRLHMRTHSGDRPYPCPHCEKTFTRGSQLTIHLRSHSGERPYKCKSCEKSFTNSSKLRRHEHVHSNEKPFKCSFCQKTFSQATNLNSHIRSCHTHKKETRKKQPKPQEEYVEEIRQEVIQFPAHVFGIVDQNIHIQVINASDDLDGSEAFTEYILLNP